MVNDNKPMRHPKINFGKYLLPVIVPALLLVTIVFALLVNNIVTRKNETAQAAMVLQDSAKEQASTLNAILNGQCEMLEVFAASVATQDSINIPNIRTRMLAIVESSMFEHVFYITPDGHAYDDEGKVTDVSSRRYFVQAMLGKRAIQAFRSNMISKDRGFVIAVPIKKGAKIIGAFSGSYSEDLLRKLLISEIYDGKAFSMVYNSVGDYIIGSENPNVKLEDDANLFSALSSNKVSGADVETVRKNMAAGKSGSMRYLVGGEERYAVYAPMDITSAIGNKWFLLNTVPGSVINAAVTASTKTSSMLFFIIVLITSATMLFIIERERSSAKRFTEEHDMLSLREELFRVAATRGDRSVGRYDIKTGTYYCESENPFPGKLGDVIENAPQAFIDAGIIAPECVDDFIDYFSRIRAGEDGCSSVAAMLMEDGTPRWFRSDATILRDERGNPAHGIVVFYDVTEQREKEAVYLKWQQSMSDRRPDNYTLFRCNISRDASFDSQEGSLLNIELKPDAVPFNDRTKEYADQFVFIDDREAYIAFVNSDTLLAKYYRGVRSTSMDYREVEPNDDVKWRRVTIEMVEYPDSADIEAYLLYEDIDEVKRAELLTKERAETDPLTGVLNRATFIERFGQVVGDAREDAQHALLMLDIDGFKLLNDTFGHAAGDKALIDIANLFRSILRRGDLLGRFGGDEFLVFLREMPYEGVIERKARDICDLLRKSYQDDVHISASVGIAVFPRDGADFTTLYRHADAALYSAKESGKDKYAFFGDNMTSHSAKDVETLNSSEMKRRLLIIDDDDTSRAMMANIFKDDFAVDTAKDGKMGLLRMRRYGAGLSAVLLDLMMPEMDGFAVLEKARMNSEIRSIPIIVVSGDNGHETSLKVIEMGAADFVTKPIDPHLLRLRVQSAISRAENERLRAQNSYLQIQSDEELKYRTVIEATGTVLIEYDWVNGVFIYDRRISDHIAGNFDARKLWQILLSDMVAAALDVKKMQDMVHNLANDRGRENDGMIVQLKTQTGEKHWFRFNVFKKEDEHRLTQKLLLTFNDINNEALANQRLHFQAERDELTGLYNRSAFLDKAAEMIALRDPGFYIMSALDIDNFKVINDQYGTEEGDGVLKYISSTLEDFFSSINGICCRVSADNFAFLYPCGQNETGLVAGMFAREFAPERFPMPVSFSIGRYVVYDKDLPASAMYDRAYIAKQSIKGRYDENIAYFDESMREHLIHEQEIVDQMHSALLERQFEVWLQPQYNHMTGALVGAEALVRWRHPTRGLIPPADFIEIFEQNGFIYELDQFVWERTCELLRKWLDEGRDPLPISVNVSRSDIFNPDIVEVIAGLVSKHGIPTELLRLEITETAFAKSTEQIVGVAKQLMELGFVVEIDDFGSGYSSLNTLKDVPADIIKLDMKFLESAKSSARGGSIVESVVRMAKWLNMRVIAEGVETKQQADYLLSIGCVYLQGYYYARPMTADDYEALAGEVGKERKMAALETVDNMDNDSFWDPKSMETIVFNSFVGGACVFEYQNNNIELLRANQKYAEIIGASGMTIEDALRLEWSKHLDEKNLALVRNAVERSIETKDEVTEEYVFHDLPGCPKDTYLRSTLRVIASAGDRYLIYCMNENMTAQRAAEQAAKAAEVQLETIMGNIEGGVTATILSDPPRLAFANDRYYSLFGYTREQFEAEVGTPDKLVYEEDRESVVKRSKEANDIGCSVAVTYRAVKRGGEVIWVRSRLSTTNIVNIDEPVQLSVAVDITNEMQINLGLRETTNQLEFLNGASKDMLATDDPDTVIQNVLDKTIGFFASARAYIFELSQDGEHFSNTYEVCAEGVTAEIDNLQNVPIAAAHFWFDAFTRGDEYININVNEIGKGREEERRVLEEQGIRSLIVVPLRSKEHVRGLLGVDDPTRNENFTNRLVALGDYLSVILQRRDMTAKARSDSEAVKSLMDGTPGGFARKQVMPDGSLVTLYVNDGLCDVLGMTREELMEGVNGGDYMWGIHHDDVETVRSSLKLLISDGESRGAKYRRRHKDGHYVWFLVSSRMTVDDKGGKFLNVYYNDLSEQEKREIDMKDKLPVMISAMLESSSDLAFIKDVDLNYICGSDNFAKITKVPSAKDLPGKTDYDLFDKEMAENFRADDRKLIEGGESLIDYIEEIPGADGGKHWSSTSKYLLHDTDGNVIGLYGVGRDVTEYKETSERLEMLMKNINGGVGVYEIAPDGKIRTLYRNNGASPIMGYTEEEYDELLKTSGLISVLYEEDRHILADQIEEMRRSGAPINCTYRIHTKGGGYKWIDLRGTLAERRGGSLIVNAVIFDVTDKAKAEEEFHARMREMERALAQIGRMTLVYDIKAGTLTMPEPYAEMHGVPPVLANFPECAYEYGVVKKKDLESYLKFYEDVRSGVKRTDFEMEFNCPDGKTVRERVKTITINDADGKPDKAIIAVEIV
ncbi:MAG: EAL domain-containing protein [Synergistaceae bacterium]|nr:EAL domain-containing protein [Synergistaceae bacterium]